MTKRYKKKGAFRANSYNVLDCYKYLLKGNNHIIKFISPKEKKKDGHPLNDYYTVVIGFGYPVSSGQQIKVHLKSDKDKQGE